MEEAGNRKGLAGESSDCLCCWAFAVGDGRRSDMTRGFIMMRVLGLRIFIGI